MSRQGHGSRLGVGLAIALGWGAASPAFLSGQAQVSSPPPAPVELVRAAVANEIAASRDSLVKHLFRSRKQRSGGSQTKLYVQTTDAMAGMLIANDDKPISAQQMDGERAHLEYLASDRDALRRKQKQEREDADRTLRILKALPDAFLYEYAGHEPGQADMGKLGDELVRLKFRPNPNYDPPSRVEQVLAGMEGYLLLDQGAQRLAKIEAQLFREVSFGWGILGHLDKGGSLTVIQADVGDGSWEITRMGLSLTGKILWVKSVAIQFEEGFTDFRRVPDDTTFTKGVELLKAEAAKLQIAGPATSSASRNQP